MSRILVIDDDLGIYGTINSLAARLSIETAWAASLAEGLARLAAGGIDLVFLDVRLPDGNGLTALPSIRGASGNPEVIILTGVGDPEGAELAMQNGVWDYLVKPASVKAITFSINRALQYRREKCGQPLPVALHRDAIVGASPLVARCLDLVAQAARSRAGVLLTGDTGTGKEIFARTIHGNSPRAAAAFVTVDCAALPEALVESILFGHARGAFTGAESSRVGLVKQADGGTLFLDEVGELPLSVQKSFLRVLQERSFRPVGAAKEEQSDFRLIAATNRDLDDFAREGKFRSDLLFRIKTIEIRLPPLRDRGGDLKLLAMDRIIRLCEEYGLPTKGFDPAFFDVLASHDWPGNVRELFNVLERAFVAAGREPTLYPMHLPAELRARAATRGLAPAKPAAAEPALPASLARPALSGIPDAAGAGELGRSVEAMLVGLTPPFKDFKQATEAAYLRALIAAGRGGAERMIEISGLSRSHFYALLKKHGLTV
jgi:two-component system NtrC family response regulator